MVSAGSWMPNSFKLTVTFFSFLAFPDYAVPLSWTNTEPEMCHRLDRIDFKLDLSINKLIVVL